MQVKMPHLKSSFQDRELSSIGPSVALDTRHLTIQSGTVTLIPATTEADPIEVLPVRVHYYAPSLVSCERFTVV